MVPRDTVNAAAVQGSVMNQKCEKKAPKKIHKSEREKRKRGTQNDLFSELGAMLGMCILLLQNINLQQHDPWLSYNISKFLFRYMLNL
jgi:hypothetical protein